MLLGPDRVDAPVDIDDPRSASVDRNIRLGLLQRDAEGDASRDVEDPRAYAELPAAD